MKAHHLSSSRFHLLVSHGLAERAGQGQTGDDGPLAGRRDELGRKGAGLAQLSGRRVVACLKLGLGLARLRGQEGRLDAALLGREGGGGGQGRAAPGTVKGLYVGLSDQSKYVYW